MQGKGLVLTFATVMALMSLYYLSFTWYTNNVETKANKEVQFKMDSLLSKSPNLTVAERESYQNSFKNNTLSRLSKDTLNLGIVKYDYNTAKEKEMSLGLDLKGGMNVILQVSIRDLLSDLADKSQDPDFLEVLNRTTERQKASNAEYIDDFFTEYNAYKQEKGGLKLAAPSWFGTRNNSELININTSDAQAEKVIRDYIESKVSTAFQVIRARIDQFGVTQPVVQRVGERGSGRILVELPGVKDTDRVKNLLQSTAKLEFWEAVRMNNDIAGYFTSLSNRLSVELDSTSTAAPLISKMVPSQGGASHVFVVPTSDTAEVNKAIHSTVGKSLLPGNLRNFKFLWGNKTIRDAANQETDLLPLYAIRGNAKNEALMDGGSVTSASADRQTQTFGNEVMVSMQMNSQGAQNWYEITKKFNQKPIAIVLDNLVYSAPNINEPIAGGRSQISGDFTFNEAKDLSSVLSAGSLPASASIIQADVVGPSLGKEAIQAGILSFAIALALVFVYMILFYSGAGIVSVIALITNLLFLFGILVSFGAVLTLPGIAGVVLTIGMAVDANVIIYERVKEELFKGKSLKESVSIAYSWKGAISAIVDANVTTLITAIVLFFFGEGPIKGFAVTLMIGIFTSLFTSVLFAKLLIYNRLDNGKTISFGNKLTLTFLKDAKYDFLKFKKTAYIISAVLLLISVGSLVTRGLNLGIEFQNGREYKVRFDQPVASNEVAADLANVFVDEEGTQYHPNVVTIGSSNQIKISTKYKSEDDSQEVDKEVEEKLYEGLKKYLPADQSFDEFVNVGETQGQALGLVEYRKVGPSIADDITYNAFYSLGFALAMVFLYLLIRFRKWQFSAAAVLAVFHDSLIVLGLFSLLHGIVPFSLEIDVAFIAAILTVIGYSINDTVIVFDRIREFMYDHPKMSFGKLINAAINTTLTRTMNTSLTTLFVIFIIFLFGGETIRSFMFALLVGIGIGTYSSVFVASFLAYDFSRKSLKNRPE
ncbi:protein translocase subunit SecD [Weeksellaceae bacterium KMM 9724]|uniref:protein translocase subunit SecD n=1 Tax=Profundicola chukchiensis TaxID=2961959 RepID=UPI00243A6058|nr:protein translocase subunit SecD [Profundicola chukchiensis]MDG4951080.1 protein translocase subunit SecD [Profundicola chukchiensis]